MLPQTDATDVGFMRAPVIDAAGPSFDGVTEVTYRPAPPGAVIRVSRDGTDPGSDAPIVTGPLRLDQTTELRAVTEHGGLRSGVVVSRFLKRRSGRSVSVRPAFSPQYTGGGDQALVDGVFGGDDFRTGGWQGTEGSDVEAVIDLGPGELQPVYRVAARFLQDQNAWIFMPREVTVDVSRDGITWESMGTASSDVDPRAGGTVVRELEVKLNGPRVRFVRVRARSAGSVPTWHKGSGGPGWIFWDEITVEP